MKRPMIATAALLALTASANASTTVEVLTDPNPITSASWQLPGGPWHELTMLGDTFTGPDHPTGGIDSVYLKLNDLVFDLPNRPLIGQWYVQIDASAWPQAVWYAAGDATATDTGYATPQTPEPSTAVLVALGLIGVCRRGR